MGSDNPMQEKYKVTQEDLDKLKEHKLFKEKKEEEEAAKQDAWSTTSSDTKYGLCEFAVFCFPFVWKGGFCMKFVFALTFVMLFVSKAAQIGHPLILKMIIKQIQCDQKQLDEKGEGETCPNAHDIYMTVLIYAAVKFSADMLNQLREIPFSYIMANAETHIANKVFAHVQKQSLAFHLNRETGKVLRIVQKGAHAFAHIFRYLMFNLAPIITEVVFTICIVSALYPWYFWVIVVVMIILYLLVTVIVTEWRAQFFKGMRNADVEYTQKATDSLLNFETVKYFNAEDHEQIRFETALNKYKNSQIAIAKSLITLNVAQTACIVIGLITMLMMGYRVIDKGSIASGAELPEGKIDVGDFVVFNQYILQIYFPLGFLGTFWRFIRQSWTDVELVLDILDVDQSIKEDSNPVEDKIKHGEIEFKNVSFSYDAEKSREEQRTILFNLSFKVPAGKSVALVGATGSGKSTIMRLLYRFYELENGQITIDGQDIKKMKLDDLRSKIAIVPQDCVLFNDTALYNIAYGGVKDPAFKQLVDDPDRQKELLDIVKPAAERAQAHEYIMKKKLQYETVVGERGLKLSGGEKQRCAIARALLKRTPIMCFDEATSALDTETERMVQEAIDKVAKNSTSLMIAHRLSTVRNCDHIIALKHGVIMEQGSHDELLSIPNGYYRNLWEKQANSDQQKFKELTEKAQFLAEMKIARRRGQNGTNVNISENQILSAIALNHSAVESSFYVDTQGTDKPASNREIYMFESPAMKKIKE